MLTPLWGYGVIGAHVVLVAVQVSLWWQARRLREASRMPTRYEVFSREAMRVLEAAGAAAARGLTHQASEQEKLAREWFARADVQPDAPVERRALRELAQVE